MGSRAVAKPARLVAAALVFLLLPMPAHAANGWIWDPVATADGYRLYWVVTDLNMLWQDLDEDGIAETMVMVVPDGYPPWSACNRLEVVGETRLVDDIPDPGVDQIVFVTATAFNAAGESGTGWGEGTTHGPITPCPAPNLVCPLYPTFHCGGSVSRSPVHRAR